MSKAFSAFAATETDISSSFESEGASTPLQERLIKQIIEALLFSTSEPLSFQKIRTVIAEFHPITGAALRQALVALALEYENQERAFSLLEVGRGFILQTRRQLSLYINFAMRDRRAERLSQASSETLAIIAYRQPVTRSQIEAIRGVDCSGVVQTLLERQLITAVGKLDTPGRPTLYGTTEAFLSYYGLKDLSALPPLMAIENQSN